MFFPLQGQFGVHSEASVLSVAGLDLAPEHRDALAHAQEAVAGDGAIVGWCPDAMPIVAYVDLHVMLAVLQRDLRLGGPGVLERVAERLLHDAEGRQVDARLESLLLALDREVDVETGLAGAVDQPVELLDARLRSEGELLVALPEHPDDAAHLAERRAAGLLDGRERLLGLGSVVVD